MQSEAMIRKAAEAIWAIRREEEDRCDMSLDDMGGEDSSVWQEAKAALEAALPAAEPQPAPSVTLKNTVVDFFKQNGWEIEGAKAYDEPGDIKVSSVNIDDLCAALSRQPTEGLRWKPISTAPRTGARFIALEKDEIFTCHWFEQHLGAGEYREGWLNEFNDLIENP